MKVKLATILSISAIASSVLLTSISPAQSCSGSKYRTSTTQTSQVDWLKTPWAALLTLPGIALAAGLYVRSRYQDQN